MLFGNETPNDKARHTVSFVYAHGKLYQLLEHDLLCAEKHTMFLPGVYGVQVTDNEGTVHECVVFAWGTGRNRHGVCCLSWDMEALKYAAEHFSKESESI